MTLSTPWRGLRISGPGGHFEKQLLKNISPIVKLASCMKRLTPKWAITEFQKYVNKAKTLKSFQNRKSGHMKPGSWIRMLLDFSAALEFRKQQIVSQILREDLSNQEFCIHWHDQQSVKGEHSKTGRVSENLLPTALTQTATGCHNLKKKDTSEMVFKKRGT